MSKKTTLVQIKNFSFAYAVKPQKRVLDAINLNIEAGSFNVFCGVSGSGKTTLLRHLKPELAPKGKTKGEMLFFPKEHTEKKDTLKIAFVMQNPANQIIMDTVWHELAFGLENQGLSSPEIERRIAEITNFFGIEKWLNQSVANLSGGEKQILNLASNLILQPDILILDEPTTQLDPIAKRDFLQMLFYIHAETGITVLISEHNLTDLLEKADQVIFLEKGKIKFQGGARDLVKYLIAGNFPYQQALPAPARLMRFAGAEKSPLSMIEGRDCLFDFVEQATKDTGKRDAANGKCPFKDSNSTDEKKLDMGNRAARNKKPELVLEAKKLWFRYHQEADFILKEMSLKVLSHRILAVVGGNGSGKSTLLYLLSQALRPLRGKILFAGKPRIAMLGQNPETIFSQDKVDTVLREFQKRFQNSETEIEQMIAAFDLGSLLNRHPFDLSGGEKQKLALAKVLLTKPDILLLDEPTNNLDILSKEKIKKILLNLKRKMTIVLVTHDLDFAADIADDIAMLFNQKIVAKAKTQDFFQKNAYFTTTTYRLTRDILPNCITFSDLNRYFMKFSTSNAPFRQPDTESEVKG